MPESSPISPPTPTTQGGLPMASSSSSPQPSIPTARRSVPRIVPETAAMRSETRPQPTIRSRRGSSLICSTAIGTTSPATRGHICFWSTWPAARVRDLTPNDPRDVPPEYPTEPLGCGCAISPDSKELAFTENLDAEPAISTNADIFTLDLTNPAAKPVKVSTSPGGDFSPAYSPDGKYLAWRSQARAGYESDKFRLVLYDRASQDDRDLLPKFDNWVDEFAWSPRFEATSTLLLDAKGEAPYLRVERRRWSDSRADRRRRGVRRSAPFADDGARRSSQPKMTVDSPAEVVALERHAARI